MAVLKFKAWLLRKVLTWLKSDVGQVTDTDRREAYGKEWAALERFRANPMNEYQNLIQVIKAGPDFSWNGGLDYKSPSGRIRVCDDIFGFEVTIDHGHLLNCKPQTYRLTREAGKLLFDAILSKVDASVQWAEANAPKIQCRCCGTTRSDDSSNCPKCGDDAGHYMQGAY